jgi:hypothetical protein
MGLAMERDGSIIVISSMSGTSVTDGTVFPYSCAKAATNCLVQYAAIEYGPRNIRVNAISPGPIESDASRGLFKNVALRAAFEKEVPLGRITRPEDIANAALWLAGPAFVTELNLQVNGGMFLSRFPTLRELPGGAAAYQKRLDLSRCPLGAHTVFRSIYCHMRYAAENALSGDVQGLPVSRGGPGGGLI